MKKKIVAAAFIASTFAFSFVSCDNGPGKSELKSTVDSLSIELSNRNHEFDAVMNIFNKVSEGFMQINEAENRLSVNSNSPENNTGATREKILSDLAFIQQKMAENREQIAELEKKLASSNSNSAQLRKAVEGLKAELLAKTDEITSLRDELAAKNIRITELDNAVAALSATKEELTARNEAYEQTVSEQDKALNSGWYAIGSKKELKENKILTNTGLFKKGDIMEDGEVNRDYFTHIDIRKTLEIPVGAKSCKLLSTHPEGSYSIAEDENGMKSIKIENHESFWSVTKYLVVKV